MKSRIFKVIAYERVGASCCSILSILHGRCIFPALPDLPLCFSSWFVNIMLNARHEGGHSTYQIRRTADGCFFLFKANRSSSRKWKPRSFHFLTINLSLLYLLLYTLLATRTIRAVALRVAVRRFFITAYLY